jgi:anti-anti-sigma factor
VTETTLAIAAIQDGETLKIHVGGEVDLGTSAALERALEPSLHATRAVVLDLSDVTFLDSSALNALVQSQRRLRERGIGFSLVAPPGSAAARILELTHLTTTFRFDGV